HTFAVAIKRFDEYKAAGVPMLPVVHGFQFTKRQTVVYIACLLPLPLFLTSLGTTFAVVATLLNVGWLILGISGFFTKDDRAWARMIFISSLAYLTMLFLMLLVITLYGYIVMLRIVWKVCNLISFIEKERTTRFLVLFFLLAFL